MKILKHDFNVMAIPKNRRGAIKPWQALAIVAILIVGYLAFTPGGQNLGVLPGTQPTQPGKVVVTKTLTFQCTDSIAGANCGAVTIAVYQGRSNTLLETLTASASGSVASGLTYTSGTQLTIKISGNSKATEWIPLTVPTGYVTDTTENVAVYAITLGAWTISVVGTGGTTFTSSTTLLHGFNGFTGNTVTLNVGIGETTASAGYKSSYDISNLLNLYWLIQIDDGGGANSNTQYATVTGLPHLTKVGNTNYNFVVCPDGLAGSGGGSGQGGSGNLFTIQNGNQVQGSFDGICTGALSGQTIGNTVAGYNAAFSFNLAVGSLLAGGNIETFQLKMYYYADWNYFQANGNLGTTATQSGSTFTIKFTN